MTFPGRRSAVTKKEAIVTLAVGLVLAIVAWSPAIVQWPATGFGDGQYFQHMVDSGKVSLRRYHELPLWNPYQCGGLPLWDNPQAVVASPIMLALTGLPASKTIVIWYILHAFIGFVGAWLLARLDVGLSRMASFAAATMFAFGVAHANQYGGGHTALAPYTFMPLCLYFWRAAETSVDHAIGLGLTFALAFYNGGVYPIPFISLVLLAETFTRVWPVSRLGAIVRAGGVFAVVFVLVAGARLFPVLDQVVHNKRILDPELDYIHWQTLKDMYLDRTHAWRVADQSYVWPEYSTYIGFLGVALVAIGLGHVRRGERWILAIGLFTFLLMLGHFAAWAPWSFLKHHVFPYKSMRVPSRFRILESVFLALLVGIAVERGPRTFARIFPRLGLRDARVLLAAVGLVAIGDVFGTASSVVAFKFDGPPESAIVPQKRLFVDAENANFLDQPRQNRARMGCWDEWTFTFGAPLWYGDVPQARAESGPVAVSDVIRTQNRFTFVADVEADGAKVLVNGAWDRGWRTTVGTIAAQNKQIVVTLPKGHHTVEVYYWPIGLTAGFVSTALSLVACVAFLLRDRSPRSGPRETERRVGARSDAGDPPREPSHEPGEGDPAVSERDAATAPSSATSRDDAS